MIIDEVHIPKIPANVAPYVKALGADEAMRLFLSIGGSCIYLPATSTERSVAARTIGEHNVECLAREIGPGYIKIPLARKWVAATMKAKGASHNEIARTLRADVATVRRWFNDENQMSLFRD
ncbi:helix-turn-helix domain containing protein [Phyllobacterium leguminum]|uniref:Homeodomain-like domain-containing protein n=1 Tax=Phyllobacterium leguminum TaxID=314237 RepID=A0A318SZK9_9HYPH|nr:helix-turn-helix domain containing protein [Phyllobacterium leguminum]PYE86894.1 hypothetical protein C7477_11832 [Phyllobacterium leguminum]